MKGKPIRTCSLPPHFSVKIVPLCQHTVHPVRVGNYEIYAAGATWIQPADAAGMDVIIPLVPTLPELAVGQRLTVLACFWPDNQPPPAGFEFFLRQQVIPLLRARKKILVYCLGSHGRTGTFLASLVALLEPETADPIKAIRKRHCPKAVESRTQAEFVFSLRKESLPKGYEKEYQIFFPSWEAFSGFLNYGLTAFPPGEVPDSGDGQE